MTNYKFKNNIKINKTRFAKELGYSRQWISSVLNGRPISKTTAFYIAKAINQDAKIDDYFDIVK